MELGAKILPCTPLGWDEVSCGVGGWCRRGQEACGAWGRRQASHARL